MFRFSTNTYPKEQRWEAWRFALQRKSIELLAMNEDAPYGEMISYQSLQKLDITTISSTPQKIKLDLSDRADHVWLILMLEGSMLLTHNNIHHNIYENGLIFGDSKNHVELDIPRDHRFLLTIIPKSFLSLRIRHPLPEGVKLIASDSGAGHIVSGMLRSVANTISDLNTDRIRPVEISLPEFLLSALMEDAPVKSMGGAAGARAMLLERVFQTIEMHLSNPELNIQQVASEHGISVRYLQKLFESVGESFGHYIKARRLERCRMDLLSPLHAQKSISEILFQWGFNDSSSFSRAFREQYGVSPREYRKSLPSDYNEIVPQRGRPTQSNDENTDDEISDREFETLSNNQITDFDEEPIQASQIRHHYLNAIPEHLHWGYLNRNQKPVLRVHSGDYVTIETLTHHAADDYERMIDGDQTMQDVYEWKNSGKRIERRGAGPMDSSALGRGAGEGFGVHICTGPIAIAGAKPGDIVEVKFIEITPRPSQNPKYVGRSFGSNVAAYWGFHFNDLLSEPKQREVITIYEVEKTHEKCCAHAIYNFRFTPQIDPYGVKHERYDYPGIPINPQTITRNFDIMQNIEVPIRPHFGFVALAPAQDGFIDSVPPANFGGNIDNWRLGKDASIFLPVNVEEGLLSIGDPHASQGDAELCGTAIECSMTGLIQIILHPKSTQHDFLKDLDYPLIENGEEWVILGFSQPNYLRELGEKAQSEVYKRASIDTAMRDAFRKARRFLMTTKGLDEDEAISLLSVGVDFGISQVVNGNWGVHAIIRKNLFNH